MTHQTLRRLTFHRVYLSSHGEMKFEVLRTITFHVDNRTTGVTVISTTKLLSLYLDGVQFYQVKLINLDIFVILYLCAKLM